MVPRLIVPVGSQLPEEMRKDSATQNPGLMVPRRLIPGGAHAPLQIAPNGGGGKDSRPAPMVPKALVPTNAVIGEAAIANRASTEPVFAEALLERVTSRRNKPAEWGVSLAVHIALAMAIMVLPLLYTQRIDFARFTTTYLAAPPLPAPPPPAAPLLRAATQQAPRPSQTRTARLVMPTAIPKAVPKAVPEPSGAAAAPPDVAGVPGGIEGGMTGGVLGGILSAEGPSAPPAELPLAVAPAAPAANANTLLRVGGDVKPPHAIYKPAPEYPVLARQTRVHGEVEIDAVIDRGGNVVSARAMTGPPLLIAAALKAVQSWRYEPTYLNGQAYPIELTVHVTFNLS